MGVGGIHMADAVLLLVFSGILMLFDDPVYIVIHCAAGHDPGLAASIHGKLIQIIGRIGICYIYALFDLAVKKLPGLFIYPVIICVYLCRKLCLRTVNI